MPTTSSMHVIVDEMMCSNLRLCVYVLVYVYLRLFILETKLLSCDWCEKHQMTMVQNTHSHLYTHTHTSYKQHRDKSGLMGG